MVSLQVEVLLPYRVEIPIDGLGSLLGLANLHCDIRVTGSCLIFGLKALSA